ncbi:MAG TPA: bifunctional serine/threonine-protein kinase/formylglycine-generating enzyme family protein [Myxococcota bacterium]|nr:bifunctional serine/threonine-protein kinase/formylglycine-generating enzyme family protein [Myxococcota bacterium]
MATGSSDDPTRRAAGDGGEGDETTTARGAEAVALRPTDAQTAALTRGLSAAPGARPTFDGEDRYVRGELLGRGGMGEVVAALDRQIGRVVALKTLHGTGVAVRDGGEASAEVRRFMSEARITGQLEHPGVVPIHDLGVLPDGRPFYTMRVVKHRTLADVLRRPELCVRWPVSRLCAVLVQVSRALAYAHARGVVHRDLKPANVLLGDFGEVYVADWGIAKVRADGAGPGAAAAAAAAGIAPEDSEPVRVEDSADTVAGSLLGTPGCMPPEQARGRWHEVDHRADLFALGVILYEVLSGRRPFEGPTRREVLAATLRCRPTPPRVHVPGCPLVLEELCLRLLAERPQDRPESAAAVAEELEAYLDGAKETRRRHEEASRLVERAAAPLARWRQRGDDRARLQAEAQRLAWDVRPWEPAERKQPAWDLEEQARAAGTERALALAEALELHTQALGYDPAHAGARAGLADLYWAQAREADAERREPARRYYEALLANFDDGRYARLLRATARLSLRTDPPGAEVTAQRLVERHRVLRPVEVRALGRTPLDLVPLEEGSWVLELRRDGYAAARWPVLCRRGEHHEGVVTLYREAEVGAGFVHVPAGRFVMGGDPDAYEALPRQEIAVGDFAMARFPVTFDEWLEMIHELWPRDRAEAERRLPRAGPASGTHLEVREVAPGRFAPHWEILVEGEGRRWCPPERAGSLPVLAVHWFDATAFARWRAARDGAPVRLATEVELEKAARGVDGRWFPWGDGWDPRFCKMRESRPGLGQPEPVGAFPADESVYGVRDLAGGMRTWAADVQGVLGATAAAGELEPAPGAPRESAGLRAVRGGSWFNAANHCRAASRNIVSALYRASVVGLRLARSLPPRAPAA